MYSKRNQGNNMATRKAKWFVRRPSDNAMLGRNGKWYTMFAGVEDIKFYSSSGRAHKYGLENKPGTAFAVYPDDVVDVVGNIHTPNGTCKPTYFGQQSSPTITAIKATIENMDCVDSSDLQAVVDFIGDFNQPLAAVQTLLRVVTPRNIEAVQNIRAYARMKLRAMRCRLDGQIQAALNYEGCCDEIYARLPDEYKW